MPQPETVLMHTNNANETVRRTRLTIVRSCGIYKREERKINRIFGHRHVNNNKMNENATATATKKRN